MQKLTIDLRGPDGNLFALIGIVARKLQDSPKGGRSTRNSYTSGALVCADYDSVLDYSKDICEKHDIELSFLRK
jgi:hypothetical protein